MGLFLEKVCKKWILNLCKSTYVFVYVLVDCVPVCVKSG
jgi:hypothetical protein